MYGVFLRPFPEALYQLKEWLRRLKHSESVEGLIDDNFIYRLAAVQELNLGLGIFSTIPNDYTIPHRQLRFQTNHRQRPVQMNYHLWSSLPGRGISRWLA